MDYTSEARKLLTGQYIYAAVRLAVAVIVPCVLLSYFGLLREYFAFPLGVSFLGIIDQPGPFFRRRNTLLLGLVSFFLVTLTINLTYTYPWLVILEIIFFGMFYSLIGVYGTRMAALGALSLIVFAIFINGHYNVHSFYFAPLVLTAGGLWYILLFTLFSSLQPYKLPKQMLGESFIELGTYVKMKAVLYGRRPDFNKIFDDLLPVQIQIKNQHEGLREILFETRRIVNESTVSSRQLMQLFLENVDLFEKLLTSQQDYEKLYKDYAGHSVIEAMQQFVYSVGEELFHIGLALQAGQHATAVSEYNMLLEKIKSEFNAMLTTKVKESLLGDHLILDYLVENFMSIGDSLDKIYYIYNRDKKLASSLIDELDLQKFIPHQERFNFRVLKYNLSLKSQHFRHALRLTIALLIGYLTTLALGVLGHPYWVLITIIAIMRPAYGITKSRNKLRIYGTILGGLTSFMILYLVPSNTALFVLFILAFVLCYTFLKNKYLVAVFFMTIYLFIGFHFIGYGDTTLLFKDRLLDTLIGSVITFLVSFLILPVWEHTKNKPLIMEALIANREYFEQIISLLRTKNNTPDLTFKLFRKNALISLANLSDNFQRMLSDPANKRKNLQHIHQFVSTTNTLTSYLASLSMYARKRIYEELIITDEDAIIQTQFDNIQRIFASEPANPREIKKLFPGLHTTPDPDIKNIKILFRLISGVVQEQSRIASKLMLDSEFV